jgi:hypothetical protein
MDEHEETLIATVMTLALLFGLMGLAPHAHADTLQQWQGSICQPGTLSARKAPPDVPHAIGADRCFARTNGNAAFAARFPTVAAAEYDVGHLYMYYGGGGTFITADMSDHSVVVFYAPGDSGTVLSPLRSYGFSVLPYPSGPGAIPVPLG